MLRHRMDGSVELPSSKGMPTDKTTRQTLGSGKPTERATLPAHEDPVKRKPLRAKRTTVDAPFLNIFDSRFDYESREVSDALSRAHRGRSPYFEGKTLTISTPHLPICPTRTPQNRIHNSGCS